MTEVTGSKAAVIGRTIVQSQKYICIRAGRDKGKACLRKLDYESRCVEKQSANKLEMQSQLGALVYDQVEKEKRKLEAATRYQLRIRELSKT